MVTIYCRNRQYVLELYSKRFNNICSYYSFLNIKCLVESEVTADTIEDIVTCWEGDEGMELHHENGIKTDNLVPKHSYVPWVTFNDVRTIEYSSKSTMHFFLSIVPL